MNQKQFDEVLEHRIDLIRAVLSRKREEYAPDGSGDRLHNFRRVAAMLNSTSEEALVGMLSKHLVSVLDIVDGIAVGNSYPSVEMIEEKIGDSINYLILLEAMLKEGVCR